MDKRNFEIVARAVIQKDGALLFCQAKGNRHYFLPGGHIEFGESAKEALARELHEELGAFSEQATFIGAVENIYVKDNIVHHEFNFVFDVSLDKAHNETREEHIAFTFLPKSELSKAHILPIALKKAVIVWLETDSMFFIPQKDNRENNDILYHQQ